MAHQDPSLLKLKVPLQVLIRCGIRRPAVAAAAAPTAPATAIRPPRIRIVPSGSRRFRGSLRRFSSTAVAVSKGWTATRGPAARHALALRKDALLLLLLLLLLLSLLYIRRGDA